MSRVADRTPHPVRGSESPVITGHAALTRLQVGWLDQIFTLFLACGLDWSKDQLRAPRSKATIPLHKSQAQGCTMGKMSMPARITGDLSCA